ncbi:transcription factor [Striga asiatica]|uniref:Transcription factor n=1 Tax=Striga asiatica TaxID=4170 RepID=A0A5A7PBX6_STRAF|nr:transcription factor [Striga asiatica]
MKGLRGTEVTVVGNASFEQKRAGVGVVISVMTGVRTTPMGSPLIHATTLRRPLLTFSLILQLFTRSSFAETGMASTILSPSSSSPCGDDDRHIPTALALLAVTAVVAIDVRRLPPRCWSPNETTTIIDAYRDNWCSLRRSNLRCAAPARLRRPPSSAATRWRSSASGTAASGGIRLYASSWAHFQGMDSMEKGFGGDPSESSDGEVFKDGLLGRNEIGKRAGESMKRKKMNGGSGSEVAATIQRRQLKKKSS